MVRHAEPSIQVRQIRNDELDTIKLLLLSFLICFMVFPLLTGNISYETATIENPSVQNNLADDNLLTIQLTDSSSYIATGNVSSYRGFAYSDDTADVLRFVDPINDVTLNQSIESGTLYQRSIIGVDIDEDGSTEFLILNNNGTSDNLLIVDFNDATTTKHNFSISNPSGIATGNFNAETNLDVVIFGRFGVLTLDIQTDNMIGNFSFTGFGLDACAIGRFMEPTQDSIALGISTGTKEGNLTIIAGNGTLMRTKMMYIEIFGLANFKYTSGLDDLAVSMIDGNLTVITPATMNQIFSTSGLPERSHVWTGSFDLDNQEDLVVVPELNNYSVFLNGTDGSIIQQSVVISGAPTGSPGYETPSTNCDYGDIDADNFTDLVLRTVDGTIGFLRGVDGTIGFEEPTIGSKPDQIRAFDINDNSRDDILVLQSGIVYVVISDVQSPIITPEQLSPSHPTFQDPYIEIEVGIEDETQIIVSDIFMRFEGGNWSQPIDELENAGNQYFAFLVGLPEGFYEYYLVFQDSYLNIGTLGNETNPMNFTVAGHLAWSDIKNQNTGLNDHLMGIGNTSDGSEVIYILDSNMDEVWLERYTPRGENQTLGLVANHTFSDFGIYTGMMDGDNILDPIIVLYNATALKINVTIYHGASGLPWFSTQYPYANFTNPHSPQAYDCDNDGIDEFFFISEHRWADVTNLIRLRVDGSWSNVTMSGVNSEFYGLALAKTINGNSVEACASAGTGPVDIINATSMNLISTHNVTRNDHLFTIPVMPYVFNNGSEPYAQFMLYMYFIDPTGYSCGFHVFDASTPRINETPLFNSPDSLYMKCTLIDIDNDGTDEIIGVNIATDELSLFRLADPVIVDWSVPIGNSEFLSSVIVDFDGDSQDEIAVFTKEDEMLRIVSLDGILERTMTIGKCYGSIPLSNIDLGYGEEIVTYPLVQDGIMKIAVIRDVVLIRRLNASLMYEPEDLLQGESLSVYVDVTNIYSESINDAEVYLTIHYRSGSSIVNQTKALIFETSNYSTSIAVNWPIGIVNLSLSVNHILYDVLQEYYPNALTVRSPLDVFLYTREVVMQNSTFSANITVTDSLGVRIPDAAVLVSLDGTDYPALYVNAQYQLLISNIDLIPGEYEVNASVMHLFAESPAFVFTVFRLETSELQIQRDIPIQLNQDDEFTGWLNVTDSFSNPIENAEVMMISGSTELTLNELAPGCYFLNSTVTLSVGNHTFEIFIEHEFIQGTSFGDVQIIIMGNLSPIVPDIAPVSGGNLFDVTVFIYDIYGTTPSDAWVIIEIDGRNVSTVQLSGGRFTANLNATYAIGEWNFTVFYGSEYSYAGKLTCDLIVLSTPTINPYSPDDWIVGQGNSTIVEVQVYDWLHSLIEDASVTLYIRGTTYTLVHIADGLYQIEISSIGWPYGLHIYYLTVDHDYMYQLQEQGNITIMAEPTITIRPSSLQPVQGDSLIIEIEITDLYRNPITDLEVLVQIDNVTQIAEESSVRGTYVAIFEISPVGHGLRNITVNINGALSNIGYNDISINVDVYLPPLDTLGTYEISVAAGLSLLLSLVGMILFVKVSSVISTAPRNTEDVTNSINQLDRIYVILVAISAVIFIHSWSLFTEGAHGSALIESVILLGSSVLLYGLWLYRDAYSSILQKGTLSKRRIALGMWHLFLVPFMVLIVFQYGEPIEIFQQSILEVPKIIVGEFQIEPLLATVLATYISSIVVVVASFYREIRKGLQRIDDMVDAGTPKNVVDGEQALLIGRTGSSIRIKFLMFFIILGATTIMQLEFLQKYSMAAIVLIPIVFLVLIPFVSSRIVKGFPKLMNRFRRTDKGTLESVSVPVIEGVE